MAFSIKKQANLNFKKNTTFKIRRTPFLPSSLGGLALWLKADAGVTVATSGPYTYVSQIVISGSNTPNVNGTYTATSVPTFDWTGKPNDYVLNGIDFVIEWASGNNYFYLQTGGWHEYWTSSDGVNWTVSESRPDTITISGSTTPDVNGVYTRPSGEDIFYGPTYAIDNIGNFALLNWEEDIIYYTASSANGPWTIVNGSGAITSTSTLAPRGSITATKVVSSSAVTAWADQSGNGRNASSYNGPQLITNQINGKPVIDFNASQYFTSNNQNLNNNSSIFFVVKSRGDHAVMLSTSDYEGLVFTLTPNPNNSFSVGISNLFEIANDGADNGNNWMIGSTIRSNNLTSIIYKNGIQVANGDYDTSSLNPTAPLIIGTDADLNSYWNLDGQIAEIIIYNRTLTLTERQQVEAYLSNKYAIQIGLNSGLLAYWKLDTTGWIDSSGNGRNLTLVGSLSNPAGLLGNSATGFSDSNYLITPSGLAPLSGKRTYSCWVYFNSNDIGYQIIWGQGGTEDYQSTYPFIIETNNQITSWFTTENGYWTNGIDSGIIPDTDVWYHLVLTFDGNIGILYVNGTSVGSSEYSGSILAPDIDRFLFGRYYTDIDYNDNGFNPLTLDGKIDEVGVWDRALSQQEIISLYNAGAGKTYPFN
jgi:hypothetical protein